jgi:hypothetical protein
METTRFASRTSDPRQRKPPTDQVMRYPTRAYQSDQPSQQPQHRPLTSPSTEVPKEEKQNEEKTWQDLDGSNHISVLSP